MDLPSVIDGLDGEARAPLSRRGEWVRAVEFGQPFHSGDSRDVVAEARIGAAR